MKTKLFLLILATAAIVRFLFLGQFPPNLTMDEVAIGYDAYSIAQTGRDQWGNFLPSSFRSVGDYKSPFYIYLLAPLVKIFGLTETVVRLPVAFFSLATVFLLILLTRRFIFTSSAFSLITGLLLALSGWHLTYSRSGYEAVISLFFVLLCFYFQFQFIKKPALSVWWAIFLTGLLAGLSYHSAKIFLPLTLIGLFFLYPRSFISLFRQEKKTRPGILFLTLLAQLILLAVFAKLYLFGPGAVRAKMTFLAVDFEFARALLPKIGESFRPLLSPFLLFAFWAKRYLEYFSPNFYLYSGLELTLPNQIAQGVLTPIETALFYFGFLLWLFWRPKKSFLQPPAGKLVFLWFFLAFVPASLANNSQQPLRAILAAPAIFIFITYALLFLWRLEHRRLIFTLLAVFYLAGLVRFADYYLVHLSYQLSEYKHYGWKETAQYALNHAAEYETVYVDPRFGTAGPYIVGVPHLYFLFYSKFDPAIYQNLSEVKSGRSNFANFRFEEINWFGSDHSQNNLYLGSPWSFPLDQVKPAQIKYTVKYPNGQTAFMVVADR